MNRMPEARFDDVADWYEEKFLTMPLARDIARWADGKPVPHLVDLPATKP